MEKELAELRQQNAMQQVVIRQLLSLNSLLRQKLQESGIAMPDEGLLYSNSDPSDMANQSLYSNPGASDGINQSVYSNSQTPDGTNGSLYSNSETRHGINQSVDSNSQAPDGINKSIYSISRPSDGINHLLYSNSRASDGIKEENYSNSGVRDGIKVDQHPLPAKIALTERNINSVSLVLRQAKLFHIRLKHLSRISRLLIHIYNGGGGSISDLVAASGHSKSGMAKLLMTLRHKGILVKHGVRNHQLSPVTLQLLAKASLE